MHRAEQGPAGRHPHLTVASLTPRQREIADLIAGGLTNAEIGARLTITEGTMGNHVEKILRRMGARNRILVAVWVAEYRLCARCRDAS